MTTTAGAHAPTRRRWSRRRKITIATTGLLLVGVLVAVALTLIRAPIVGEAEVPVSAPDLEWTAANVSTGSSTADCTASVSAGTLTITVAGDTLDEFCVFQGTVRTVGEANQDFVVQDLVFTDVTVETLIDQSGVPSCGKPVDENGTMIAFKVRYEPGAAPGSYPAAAEAGLVAVNVEDYDDEACPAG